MSNDSDVPDQVLPTLRVTFSCSSFPEFIAVYNHYVKLKAF